MNEQDIKKYAQIKELLAGFADRVDEIKVVFQSNLDDSTKSFSSYQFPINIYDEEIYGVLKKYAELDYEINKRYNNKLDAYTNFKFYNCNDNSFMGTYRYEQDLAFLESMINNKVL